MYSVIFGRLLQLQFSFSLLIVECVNPILQEPEFLVVNMIIGM